MRARLLSTIALESRGTGTKRAREAAREAEQIARNLDDPALLAFALNGVFMQTFDRAGLAPRRDEIGAELVDLSVRHDLASYEVLGRLIRLQASSALADFAAADEHAAAVDRLAERHERPLVGVFTTWYRALRLAASGAGMPEAEAAYRDAAARMQGSGMPGLEDGLLPLALLSSASSTGNQPSPRPNGGRTSRGPVPVLLARDRPREAAGALRDVPEPPHDLLFEALWCLTAYAALAVDDRDTMQRAHDASPQQQANWPARPAAS